MYKNIGRNKLASSSVDIRLAVVIALKLFHFVNHLIGINKSSVREFLFHVLSTCSLASNLRGDGTCSSMCLPAQNPDALNCCVINAWTIWCYMIVWWLEEHSKEY